MKVKFKQWSPHDVNTDLMCSICSLPPIVNILHVFILNTKKILFPSDTWSTCTHTNVIRGVWATPTSSRQPSTVIGGRADDRASAAPSSPTRPTGRPPCSRRPNSPRLVWACRWAPMGLRWPPSRRSRKVRFVCYAALISHGINQRAQWLKFKDSNLLWCCVCGHSVTVELAVFLSVCSGRNDIPILPALLIRSTLVCLI